MVCIDVCVVDNLVYMVTSNDSAETGMCCCMCSIHGQ